MGNCDQWMLASMCTANNKGNKFVYREKLREGKRRTLMLISLSHI